MLLLDELRSNFVIGIDIVQPGTYAYAVLINNVVVERGEVSDRELIKIIKKYRPLVLAIDNLRELLDLGRRFLKALSRLPFPVHIVQVTRVRPDLEVSVEELVREYLGENVSKLSPVETAEYLARLVCKGVGSLVKLYEPETKILIKARIGTRDGGMSCRRFERNVYLRIKQLVQEIATKLSQSGLDYDLFFTDAESARSATFIVYADKSVVRKVVKPVKSMDVVVLIEQVMSSSIKYVSLSGEEQYETKLSERYVIVGVDPGVVTGVAVLDLNGNVLLLHSGRNLSRRQVLDLVYSVGTPIVIATDVASPPDYVKKLCAMTRAVLYTPDQDMSVAEKSELASKLIREQHIQIRDPHQRDALAAAYRAYLEYKPKLDKVVEEVRKLNLPIPIDEVKALVIRGYSIKQAIDTVVNRLRKSRELKVIIVRERDEKIVERVRELETRVKLLEAELRKISEEKRRLEEDIQRLQDEAYLKIRRDLEIRELAIRVDSLEKELSSLRFEKQQLEQEIETLRRAIRDFVLEGRYVAAVHVDLLRDGKIQTEVAYDSKLRDIEYYRRVLRGFNVRVLLVEDSLNEKIARKFWDELSIVVLPLNQVQDYVKISNDVILVNRTELDKMCEDVKQRFRRELTTSDLLRIVSEYRQLRGWS